MFGFLSRKREHVVVDGNDFSENVPNAETLKAFEEADAIKKNPALAKGYTDVDEMFRELLS